MSLEIPIAVRDCVGCTNPNALVSVGVPFGKGVLRSHRVLSLLSGGKPVPCQTLVLSRWPDASVKWVLVDFLADIPAQGQVQAILVAGARNAKRPLPEQRVRVTNSKSGRFVENGVLAFRLQKAGFRLLQDLEFMGKPILEGVDGFVRKAGSEQLASSRCTLQSIETEQAGSVKVILRLRGTFEAEKGRRLLDFTARLTVAAGAPWVRVEWCVINPGYDLTHVPDPRRQWEGEVLAGDFHDRAHTPIDLVRLDFDVALPDCHTALLGGDVTHTYHYEVHPPAWLLVPHKAGEPKLYQAPGRGGCRAWACGHGPDGHDWVNLGDPTVPYKIAPRPLHRRLPDGSETISLLPPLAGWVHLTNGSSGFTVQVQHFYENRPKKISVETNRLTIDLWPSEEGTLLFEEGCAKTHILTLSLFDLGKLEGRSILKSQGPNLGSEIDMLRLAHVDTIATARSVPIVARLDPKYVQETGAVGDIFPPDPERFPTIEMALRVASRNTRRSGQGMMNFGDEGSDGYYHNNQYDWQLACFLYFLRTGMESAFIDGEASTWHSMDIDTIHHHRNPLLFEGQHDGRSDHTALPVDPHMLYCQGILAYYHLTGHRRALEIACGIARNAVRQLREGGMVFNNARTAGWSLLCVAAVHEETRDRELGKALEEYFDRLERWQDKDGAFARRVASGHNGYWRGSNAFMSGILLSALYRAYEATGSERARRLFLQGVDHLVERMTLPHGIIASTEGPPGENSFCTATSYSMHGQTQALAWASKLTGDSRYIEQAVRFFEFGLRFEGLAHLCDIRMSWWALFRFLHIAAEFGLLERVERSVSGRP